MCSLGFNWYTFFSPEPDLSALLHVASNCAAELCKKGSLSVSSNKGMHKENNGILQESGVMNPEQCVGESTEQRKSNKKYTELA